MRSTLVVALNRPRLLLGIDKRLFAACCMVSFGIAMTGEQTFTKTAVAGAVFLVLAVAAHRLTKWDANMMSVIPSLLKQKTIYDPGKRADFRVNLPQDAK